jgi:hypothetical protein
VRPPPSAGPILTKLLFSRKISIKVPNIKFRENSANNGSRVDTHEHEATSRFPKLREFPKNGLKEIYEIIVALRRYYKSVRKDRQK